MVPGGEGSSEGADGSTQEVLACEEEGRRAFLARDVETLDRLWCDELLVNSPIQRVHEKRQVLDLLRAGTIAHVSYDVTPERIEARGDLCVVMGHEVVVNAPGGPAVRRRYTNVWRREAGTWRLLVRHASHVSTTA